MVIDVLTVDIAQNDTTICEGDFINLNSNIFNSANLGSKLVPGNISCETEYINVSGCNGQSSILYNGYEYDLVEIGGQCWFKENLRTSHYSDGTPIFYPDSDNTAWENNFSGAYAWWQNDSTNSMSSNGALYNGYAVSNDLGVCPVGWQVPSDCDFMYLENSLGMGIQDQQAFIHLDDFGNTGRGTDQGSQLKSLNFGGNNSSAFTLETTGYRSWHGSTFGNVNNAQIWTSTNNIARGFKPNNPKISKATENPNVGIGVRCVKKKINSNIIYSWNSGETTSSITAQPTTTTTYTCLLYTSPSPRD